MSRFKFYIDNAKFLIIFIWQYEWKKAYDECRRTYKELRAAERLVNDLQVRERIRQDIESRENIRA